MSFASPGAVLPQMLLSVSARKATNKATLALLLQMLLFCPPGRQQTLNSVVRLHLRCGQPPPCCNAPSQTQQKEVTPKDDLRNLLIDYNLRLAFSDSACRAGSFASTAGYANISVDVVLCIALGNSSNGAAVSTSTARYASVRNYICHK